MDRQAPPPDAPVSEDELHALVDGRLREDERLAVEARLARDPQAMALRAAWARQRAALQSLHAEVADEPLPASLAGAARRASEGRRQIGRWGQWGAMAAGVVLAFGLGWLSHGRYGAWPVLPSSSARLASVADASAFAHQATLAHVVYAPEVRHPVEVAAAQQEHLVQWLSKRLNRPLKVPDLSAQGYELVGGRLLPGDAGARAQFMFQNAGGERVTLYLGALKEGGATGAAAAASANRRETAFSFSTDGPVPGFYWVDQGFGYALSGKLPREKLVQLAEAVYRQL